jgi:hypothetical protein
MIVNPLLLVNRAVPLVLIMPFDDFESIAHNFDMHLHFL